MTARRGFPVVFPAALLLLAAGPARACSDKMANRFDWDACWSYSRGGAWLAAVAVSWWLAFHVLFPWLLQPGRPKAPWPRDAFGRSLAVCWLLAWAVFLFLFGALAGDLRQEKYHARWFPGGSVGTFLNQNWLWLLVVLVALAGALLIVLVVRHPRRQAAA
jgi:hypothetical protein